MIPCNIWLLDSPEMVLNYSLQGGKVIFITEDSDPRLDYIPNKLSAKILLPPLEVVDAELDGRLDEAEYKYGIYLSNMEPGDYVSTIIAALVYGIPVGLYFGSEFKDLRYPVMFINYLYNQKGIIVGYREVQPAILDNFYPMILAEIYLKGLIGVDMFMMSMPADVDIPQYVQPLLVNELRPPISFVKNGDFNGYFKGLIKDMKAAGKYLYSPIVAASNGD